MLEEVLQALMMMRAPFAPYEKDLHALVAERLTEAGLCFTHEAMIAPRCRIDFLVGTVGIEIKKGKPDRSSLREQVTRYAASDRISALIVLSERNVSLPESLMGKPVRVIVLNSLWGVALP